MPSGGGGGGGCGGSGVGGGGGGGSGVGGSGGGGGSDDAMVVNVVVVWGLVWWICSGSGVNCDNDDESSRVLIMNGVLNWEVMVHEVVVVV